MGGDVTARRIAENQSRFREANEQIEAAADRMRLHGFVPFICECPRERCTAIVQLTLEEYEGVRMVGTRFLCTPGHQDVSVEAGAGAVAVEVDDRYVAVDKIGIAGEVAAERYDDLSR